MPIPFVAPLLNIFSSYIGKRQERKGKEADARANWESAMGRSMENGWKDEYITVVITFPLWQIFIGNLLAAFTEDAGARILAANAASMKQIGELMATPFGDLMMVVVLAAVGIKGYKAFR